MNSTILTGRLAKEVELRKTAKWIIPREEAIDLAYFNICNVERLKEYYKQQQIPFKGSDLDKLEKYARKVFCSI